MIVIGEKLNSSIPSIFESLQKKDAAFIKNMAQSQINAGAQYLDVNTAVCEDECGMLLWMTETILQTRSFPLMVDSPNPSAIAHLYERAELKNSIINSVTLEEKRLKGILPVVSRYKTGVVAMPIDEEGLPHDAHGRVENAERLIDILNKEGIGNERIYVDIIVEAAAITWTAPHQALLAARELRKRHPNIHLIAGLSNVSFGLPKRAEVNRAFLCLCISNGVDSAIMNPTDPELVLTMRAAEALCAQDGYCKEYLAAYRKLSD